VGNFLTRQKPVSFSRTVLHGVNKKGGNSTNAVHSSHPNSGLAKRLTGTPARLYRIYKLTGGSTVVDVRARQQWYSNRSKVVRYKIKHSKSFCSLLTSFNKGKTNNAKYMTFLFDTYIILKL